MDLQNRSGNTPLHWAALNGHLEAVKILIATGANSSVRNKAGHDVVYEAEINSKEDVVEWLLKEGDLDEEVANDDNTTMRAQTLEESVSPTKSYDEENYEGMGEKVEKLSLG